MQSKLISKPANIFLLLLMTVFSSSSFAQYHHNKNTIRLNITNPLIFGGKTFIIGYERTVGKHQSFSVDIGTMGLPSFGKIVNSDSVKLVKNSGDKGFHISGDYRFYLGKENKYEAPRGVYIGPYYAYNHFSRENQWNLKTSSFSGAVNSKLGLNVHTVGVELGYQFVLWKRFSIDLILIGPGVGFYSVKGSLNTNLSDADQSLLFERINNYLGDKIPGYNLVIKEGDFKRNGSVNTASFGYRYVMNFGFRF